MRCFFIIDALAPASNGTALPAHDYRLCEATYISCCCSIVASNTRGLPVLYTNSMKIHRSHAVALRCMCRHVQMAHRHWNEVGRAAEVRSGRTASWLSSKAERQTLSEYFPQTRASRPRRMLLVRVSRST